MIKIGDLNIDKFYLGDTTNAKIYLGAVKVWPKEEEPSETYPYAFQRVSRGGSAYTVDCNSTSSNTIGSGDTQSGLGKYEASDSTSDKTPVSVVFGDCCQTISSGACSGWNYLSSVTISDNVTSLGEKSFQNTYRVEHLKIGSGITQLNQSYTFYETGSSASTKPDLDLSANVGLNVGNNAFYYCYFNNVIFPKNCTLSSNSFMYCSASTLSFGSGTIISEYGVYSSPFYGSKISNIDLNGVTQIRDSAFSNTSGYTSITIPPSVTSLGKSAFTNVSTLNSVTIDYASNATLGQYVFSGSSITSLTIGSNPTSIGDNMFSTCTGLTTLVIPSNISSIGGYAFNSCSGLTSLVIPSNISSIGNRAFFDCSGLTSITVHSTTPPTLGYSVFDNTNDCPIYVPSESVDAYKAASRWSNYKSRIQAIPT